MPESQAPTQEPVAPYATVDGFKLIRRIGRGGMGEVYLARDLVLGRRVAIKVVREGVLTDPKSRERFLAEARATASFNHPNIVTLYATGELNGQPYVALEYVEGQTLAQRLADGAMGTMEAVRVAAAVAEAIREAHEHDVVHRDLKPENVIIGRDGRPRVVDFGLARLVGGRGAYGAPRVSDAVGLQAPESRRDLQETVRVDEPPPMQDTMSGAGVASSTSRAFDTSLCGTPMYMAPEQWRRQPATKASDVWALGLMLYEMVEGRHPFEVMSIAQVAIAALSPKPIELPAEALPPALLGLIEQCLEKEAAERPGIDAVCTVLGELLAGTRSPKHEELGPFRGLLPFDERHADAFFGREIEVEAFVERMREQPVLAVVAHSGSGKSSFVMAGVVPRLREQRRCVLLRMRPGADPLRALAACFANADSGASLPSPVFSRRTSRDESRASGAQSEVWHAIERELREEPKRAAVILSEMAEREGSLVLLFVDQLEELFTQDASADEVELFLQTMASAADDPAMSVRVCFTMRDDFVGRLARSAVARSLLSGLFVLQTPVRERLREILLRAVKLSGYAWEDDAIVGEMVDSVQDEPAALPLLQFAGQVLWERRDRQRRLLTKEAYGSIGGVAGALARHADSVLAAMTHSQVELARVLLLRLITPQRTRRRMQRSKLVDGLSGDSEEVVQALVDARLVISHGRSEGKGGGHVELVHEALIANWKQLASWLDDAKEELAFLREVEQAAALWEQRGRPNEEVWRGDALRDAVRRASRIPRELPNDVRDFLAAGSALQNRVARRKRLVIAGAIGVLTIAAVVLALQNREARTRRYEAEQARNLAETKQAEALYEGARAAMRRSDPLEASAKLRSALELADIRLARPLWWQIRNTPLRWSAELTSATNHVAFSPDGRSIAVGGNDGTVFRIEEDAKTTEVFRGLEEQISGVEYLDDQRLAVSTWSGKLHLWRMRDHTLRPPVISVPSAISYVICSRVGLAVPLNRTGVISIHDLESGKELNRWTKDSASVRSAAFDDGCGLLAEGRANGTVRVWDMKAFRVLESYEQTSRVVDLRFADEGRRLLSFAEDGTVRGWERQSGRVVVERRLQGNRFATAAFSSDGKLFAFAGPENEVTVIRPESGERVAALRGQADAPYRIELSPDGTSLVSGSIAKEVMLWDLTRLTDLPVEPRGHAAEVHGAAFDVRAGEVVTGGTDMTIRWWNAETGSLLHVSRAHRSRINAILIGPESDRMASASLDGALQLWSAKTRTPLLYADSRSPAMSGAFSPDSKLVATAHLDGAIRLWDAASGALVRTLEKVSARYSDVAFSRSGKQIAATASDGRLRVFEVGTGRLLRDDSGHTGDSWGVDWGPDDSILTAGEDGTLLHWQPGVAPKTLYSHEGRLTKAVFSRDGRKIVVAGAKGLAFLLDLATGNRTPFHGHRHRDVNVALFEPNGNAVITAADDGTTRRWRLADGAPLWRAPVLLNRRPVLLTHNGWRAMDGGMPDAAQARWRAAVESSARLAALTADDRTLCMVTFEGEIEQWDTDADERRFESRLGSEVRSILSTPSECWVQTSAGETLILGGSRATTSVGSDTTALAVTPTDILVADSHAVRELDLSGKTLRTTPIDVGATAVGIVGGWLAIGYREGGLEIVSRDDSQNRRIAFEQLPMSAVERIVEGPMQTLVAGYASGFVGIWDTSTGVRLAHFGLHGPAVHLLVKGDDLYAASELGDYAVARLRELGMGYCELLRSVWENVPVVWDNGRAVLRPQRSPLFG